MLAPAPTPDLLDKFGAAVLGKSIKGTVLRCIVALWIVLL